MILKSAYHLSEEIVFKQKLVEKAYFIVNDWSCHGAADQF